MRTPRPQPTRRRTLIASAWRSLLLAALLLVAATSAHADVPTTLTHQGRLIQDNVPVDGERDVIFRLYDGGADHVYEETLQVTFTNGYYTVRLGEGADSRLTNDLFKDGVTTLGITVIDNSGEVELLPRQPITTVPYAFVSQGVEGGVVNTTRVEIEGRLVIDETGAWLGDLAPGTIQSAHLSPEAVHTSVISDAAVTGAKIAPRAVGSAQLELNGVRGEHIFDGTVTSADVSDDSITSADVRDGTITSVDIAPGGGLYSSKSDLYVETVSQSLGAGDDIVIAQCADANDLPLTGSCYTTAAQIRIGSSRGLDWSSPAAPARYECGFVNTSGTAATVETQITCISVP